MKTLIKQKLNDLVCKAFGHKVDTDSLSFTCARCGAHYSKFMPNFGLEHARLVKSVQEPINHHLLDVYKFMEMSGKFVTSYRDIDEEGGELAQRFRYLFTILFEEVLELLASVDSVTIAAVVPEMSKKLTELLRTHDGSRLRAEGEETFKPVNKAELFDALLDIEYVMYNLHYLFGLTGVYEKGWKAVNDANMSKIMSDQRLAEANFSYWCEKKKFDQVILHTWTAYHDPSIRAYTVQVNGKVVKPTHFKAPNIEEVLQKHFKFDQP